MTTQTLSKETSGSGGSKITMTQLWVGRVMSALAALFCLFDGAMKLVKPPVVIQATLQLGYPESAILGIGVTLLVCTILYIVPATSTFGCVLLTGYLGGAVASNVRAGMPVFNIVFPLIIAALLWGGLWFRDRRVRNCFVNDSAISP